MADESKSENKNSNNVLNNMIIVVLTGIIMFTGTTLISIREDVAIIKTKFVYVEKYERRITDLEKINADLYERVRKLEERNSSRNNTRNLSNNTGSGSCSPDYVAYALKPYVLY